MVKKNEDPFDFDEEDEEQGTEQAPEPTPEQPSVEEVQDLRAFKALALHAQREGEISDEFEKAGYSGKLAKLWSALNPEGLPTAESLKAFADEYGVTPTRPVGYTPRAISSEPTMPTAKTYTRAEMEEIAKVNPARARSLAEAGRIKWNNPEIGGNR